MAIEHIIRDTDTIESIAERYLGDPSRWYELVEFNRLHAPYIVKTREEAKDNFGSGYVAIERTNYQGSAWILKGWKLKTRPYVVGGQVKTFTITEDVYVPAGNATFLVHAVCTVPGQYGNVSPGMVEVAGEEFNLNGIQVASMGNAEQFTGGKDTKLLATGDAIFIPAGESDFPPQDMLQLLDRLGGEDLFLDDGELGGDGFGDIRSVSGIDNIIQAVNHRLMTEKGELPLHPDYGTNIPSIIGSPSTEYTQKLIELDIYDALAYEDRIEEVEIVGIEVNGASVYVDVRFKPTSTGRSVNTQYQLNFTQRGTN